MKALTLWRPWSWALVHGGKPLENRSWMPPRDALGKRQYFHGGLTFDKGALDDLTELTGFGTNEKPWPAELRDEGIVGSGVLCGVVRPDADGLTLIAGEWGGIDPDTAEDWSNGKDFGWLFADRQALPKPIPCSGARGLWPIPPDVQALIEGREPEPAGEGEHHCHARGCRTACKPEMLMCLRHWRMVPRELRRAVWLHYRPGQCDDMSPSEAWHRAADAAIRAVYERETKASAGSLL